MCVASLQCGSTDASDVGLWSSTALAQFLAARRHRLSAVRDPAGLGTCRPALALRNLLPAAAA